MNWKQYASLIGMGLLLGITVWVLIAWLIAYLSPNYTVCISINQYNEAIPEIIFLIIAIALGIFTLSYILDCFRKGKIDTK